MSIYVPDENGELTSLNQAVIGVAETSTQMTTTDLGAAFAKMMISLVVIVVLLFVSYWFIRRLIQNRLEKGVGNAAIQIIEKRMISPKTMLYIIEVDQKRILIAESHLEVKLLDGFTLGPEES